MSKIPGIGQFHCRAELLHAALLEGNPAVRSYVPQPLRIRLGSSYYIPDCFVSGEQESIRELKPRGEFDEERHELLKQFFELRSVTFEVISNEMVFEQEQLAKNWLMIMRSLKSGENISTEQSENWVMEKFLYDPTLSLGDIVEPGNRQDSLRKEIATLRLLHRNKIKADLNLNRLDYDTEFYLCR